MPILSILVAVVLVLLIGGVQGLRQARWLTRSAIRYWFGIAVAACGAYVTYDFIVVLRVRNAGFGVLLGVGLALVLMFIRRRLRKGSE